MTLNVNAAIIVAQNFQDEEFVYPYYRMLEEGWKVDVYSQDGKDKFGKYGVPAKVNLPTIDLTILEDYYNLVFLPGGFESPDRLRMLPEVKEFVRRMFYNDKLVAAICHGPWICISAGIVKGMRVTGYQSIKDDLMNAGADYLDVPVTRDDNLITGQHYKDNPEFMKAVISYFK